MSGAQRSLAPLDRAILEATQAGLPLAPAPYAEIAQRIGISEAEVLARLQDMIVRGIIRRIGIAANHYRLGLVANGMTVWDVDDARVDALGERVGALPAVSHCYRRPRRLPLWPYNLFAMLHGRSRADVEREARAVAELLGPACRGHDILYSSAVLKKTGLRLQAGARGAVLSGS